METLEEIFFQIMLALALMVALQEGDVHHSVTPALYLVGALWFVQYLRERFGRRDFEE